MSRDLLWRPLGQWVRLVWVSHPTRDRLIPLCTDLSLDPLEIIRPYGWRFKIEVSFKQAIHTVGAYACDIVTYTSPSQCCLAADMKPRYLLPQDF